MNMIADDLFAGAGGWDIAAEALGIHARGVENMPEARATREAAGLTTIHDDVWTFTPDGTATGLIASPPCPTFSAAGKGSGRASLDSVMAAIKDGAYLSLEALKSYPVSDDDDRTRLVLTPLHFATGYEYEWLAWEQVPAVLPVWEACAEVLRSTGWFTWTGNLHSEQYGVPQTRTRAKLLASRLGPVEAPKPTHSRYYNRDPKRLDEGVEKWVSMAEGLGWADDSVEYVNGTHARAARRPGDTPAPTVMFGNRLNTVEWKMRSNYGTGGDPANRGERLASEPAPTVTSKIDRNKWHPRETTPDGLPRFAQQSDNAIDEHWPDHRPATVVAGRDLVQAPGATANRFNGSTKSRNDGVRVSVAEAAVLQSFPADFPWQGIKSKQYLQCGNAVPPGMAFRALGAAAAHHLIDRQE